MRTIRHRLNTTATTDRQGDADVLFHVTVPWRDGPESDNHGDPERPQLHFTAEGEWDGIEDVTLTADDTEALYQALHEARKAVRIAATG